MSFLSPLFNRKVNQMWARLTLSLTIRARICKLLRSPGIDSKEAIPQSYVACAEILEESIGARNRVGIELLVPACQATKAGGIDSLDSVPGLLKNFKNTASSGPTNRVVVPARKAAYCRLLKSLQIRALN
jgi:hypothetical protein